MTKRGSSPHDGEVGLRIKLRRQELGLSQTALAEAINLTFQQVQKYERGANRVSAGRLQHIAKVLNVPVTFFFDDLGGSDDGGGSEISALLKSAYALRLLKAFSKLRDTRVQRSVVEMLENISESAGRRRG